MTDRIPGAPGRCKAVVTGEDLQKLQSGEEFAITLRRDDAPIIAGTPYNKAHVLPDELAAELCPEVEDPAPKDAFAALQAGKADAGRSKSGSSITLDDAGNAPLMGLRIFGRDYMDDNGEVHIVGEKESVTVNVRGKNVADVRKFSAEDKIPTPETVAKLYNQFGTTLSATTGGCVTVTQNSYPSTSNVTSYNNGFFTVGFYCPLSVGDTITMSYNYKAETNPLKNLRMLVSINQQSATNISAADEETGLYYLAFKVTKEMVKANNWNFAEIRIGGKSGVFSNFQIEHSSVYTGYVPYQESRSLTVPTPGGLLGGDICDEIDFAKGVLIRRCGEKSETPLPEDVLEAYGKLRSYAPVTYITSDENAEMEVCYCTPSTALTRIQNPNDRGKFLTIDTDGAVAAKMVVTFVEYTDKSNGWETRIWSDGSLEMHKKATEGETIGENGWCKILYDLPFPVESDCVVQVTPCGSVSLAECAIVDDAFLALTLAGQAGTSVSAIHMSIAGRVKLGG